MTTGIVIQARMTSTRFPGKVMAILDNKPVLQHVIDQCRKVPFVDKIVCAFPADKVSMPICQLCNENKILCCSGDEHDVLGRYSDAAKMHGLDVIVRVTADCPMLDPIVAGQLIALLKSKEFDYTSNVFPRRTYPKGYDCEAFTFETLNAAHQAAKAPSDREHVTPWIQRAKGIRRGLVHQKINTSGYNLCVDYPEDIARITVQMTILRQERASLVERASKRNRMNQQTSGRRLSAINTSSCTR
jgi:spore coat polysaccharide biosynthesis protein SpsF (cytidylyltransferase family)